MCEADQKRKLEERIDALLLEGVESGQPIPVTEAYWEEKKRKLIERLASEKNGEKWCQFIFSNELTSFFLPMTKSNQIY